MFKDYVIWKKNKKCPLFYCYLLKIKKTNMFEIGWILNKWLQFIIFKNIGNCMLFFSF